MSDTVDQPRPRRRISRVMIFVFVASVVIAGGRVIRQQTRIALRDGPMVQMPEPGRLSFSWKVASVTGGAVVLSSVNGKLEHRADQDGERFEASFADCPPGTTYSYTIRTSSGLFGGTLAGPYETRTPPKPGTPFRFLAFGDSGNGGNTQADLAQLMVAAKPDLIIHTGDLIYPSGKMEDYPTNFFEPYAELIRRIPFMPSLGNHDCATEHGAALIKTFELPRNGPPGLELERNYWFDYGDARFVAIDSNPPEEEGSITNQQRQDVVAPWLRKVLSESTARWKFVYYHHPFYTGSEHPESGGEHMKTAFLKVYDECGVDMVFCGHNHLYERTAPMREDQPVADGKGTVYVTTGAGGANRYKESEKPPSYIRAYNDAKFSFTQIDLSPGKLELRQIGEDGKAIDTYSISK
ncbi:MAG: metallophosphoesterase [Planctomycetota bacterium]